MKVFISHASQDKWIAKRISSEIMTLGAETFLDEKDIETGESIDDVIAAQLKSCDEVLILLSPASVKSHWVLVEVGGAKALEKRLIPILLYLGVNEIPAPITKHLARDINSIEKYYEELKVRIHRPAASSSPPPALPSRRPVPLLRRRPTTTNFAIGERVRLPQVAQDGIFRQTGVDNESILLDWTNDMDKYLGREATITFVDTDMSVRLDIDEESNWWAVEWLSRVYQ